MDEVNRNACLFSTLLQCSARNQLCSLRKKMHLVCGTSPLINARTSHAIKSIKINTILKWPRSFERALYLHSSSSSGRFDQLINCSVGIFLWRGPLIIVLISLNYDYCLLKTSNWSSESNIAICSVNLDGLFCSIVYLLFYKMNVIKSNNVKERNKHTHVKSQRTKKTASSS